MKGGVTRRIEEINKALDQKQLKKALYLSEAKGLERHHEWIQEAARTCLVNQEDKSACEQAIRRAREEVQGTASLPVDDTSLEGLEEYMTEQQLPEETKSVETPAVPNGFLSKAQKNDAELFEECEECHVAVAASRFADVCAENREEAGGCELIGRSLANENTEPGDWIKAMVQTAEKAEGKAKQEMAGAITELTEYLERRNSPLLKAIDKEENHV
ncbi:MAG: hypothetical protein WCO26_18850 [Deltaproteobacteria bacterium]